MLFDFQEFIQKLRSDPSKKEFLEKYEKEVGPIQGDIKDQPRYKEYLSKFQYAKFRVPEVCEEDFDRDLFLRLVLGSFSSTYNYTEYIPDKKGETEIEDEKGNKKTEPKEKQFELYITVEKEGASITKSTSELRTFQVMRLFEIYVEEQMNIWYSYVTAKGEEKEALKMEMDRRVYTRRDTLKLIQIKETSKKEKEIVEQEKEKKLDELYNQL